jgi:hypothetical protein
MRNPFRHTPDPEPEPEVIWDQSRNTYVIVAEAEREKRRIEDFERAAARRREENIANAANVPPEEPPEWGINVQWPQ